MKSHFYLGGTAAQWNEMAKIPDIDQNLKNKNYDSKN